MIAGSSRLKDGARLIFWFPVRWMIQLLPFRAAYLFGGILGDMDYLLSGRQRILSMARNIASALGIPMEPARRIVRQNLRNHLRNTLELIKYPGLNRDSIQPYLTFQGLAHLEKAMGQGRGVVLMTAHFGAKQFLQVALGLEGYPLNQINYHMNGSRLSPVQIRISQRQRIAIEDALPIHFISAGKFLRPVFDCLKNKEILIIAGDGSGIRSMMNSSYLPFDFLGARMKFPTLIVRLARKTGSPILPTFVFRKGAAHTVAFFPPLDTRTLDDQVVLKDYICLLERHIGTHPSLWEFWEEFTEDNLKLPPAGDTTALPCNRSVPPGGTLPGDD